MPLLHLLFTLTGWPKAEQSGKLSDTFSEIIICRNSSISSTQKSGMMTVIWSPTGMAAMMLLMKVLTPARTILCEASTPSPHTTLRLDTWPVSWCSEDSFTIVTLASSTLQSLSIVAVHSNVKFLKNIDHFNLSAFTGCSVLTSASCDILLFSSASSFPFNLNH